MADVTAPPYDVLSAADRAALCRRSTHNVVCIDLPTDEDGEERYAPAGDRFRAWRTDGTLVTDGSLVHHLPHGLHRRPRPAGAHRSGCSAPGSSARPGEGAILPHERTTPKARAIGSTCCGPPGPTCHRCGACRWPTGSPTCWRRRRARGEWTDDDGVEHTVWRVDRPDADGGHQRGGGGAPVVIADGHHRYETSLAYRDERRAVEGTGGPADATLCLVVELVEDQLTVRAIHRLISGLPDGYDLKATLTTLGFSPGTTVSAGEVIDGRVLERMDTEKAIGLVTPDGRADLLTVDEGAFDGVADLDSARVAHALAQLPPHGVSYQHGTDLVAKAVGNGEAQFGLLLRPRRWPRSRPTPMPGSGCRPRRRSSTRSPRPASCSGRWTTRTGPRDRGPRQPQRRSSPASRSINRP